MVTRVHRRSPTPSIVYRQIGLSTCRSTDPSCYYYRCCYVLTDPVNLLSLLPRRALFNLLALTYILRYVIMNTLT